MQKGGEAIFDLLVCLAAGAWPMFCVSGVLGH